MTLKWLELQIAFGKRDLHFLQKSMFIQSDLSIVYLYDLYYGAQGCPSCGFSPKSALRVTWLIPTCVRLFGMYDMLICVTRYMSKKLTRTRRSWRGLWRFTWDMTHSYETWVIHIRHDSFTRHIERRSKKIAKVRVKFLEIHHTYVWHDSFIHLCDKTHAYARQMTRQSQLYIHCTWCIQYKVAKTHEMPYLHRSFSEKEPYN